MTVRVSELVAQGTYAPNGRWQGVDETDPLVGSGTMTRVFIVPWRSGLVSVAPAVNALVSHAENPLTTGGWTCARLGLAPDVIRWVVGLSTGVLIVDSVINLAATKLVVICASYDSASGTSRLLVNGSATSAVLAGAYVLPSAGRYFQIGARSFSNDNFLVSGGVAAVIGSDTVALDAAGLVALEANVIAQMRNGRRFTGLIANDLVYDARDAGPNSWPTDPGGSVAGVNLTRTNRIGVLAVPGRV